MDGQAYRSVSVDVYNYIGDCAAYTQDGYIYMMNTNNGLSCGTFPTDVHNYIGACADEDICFRTTQDAAIYIVNNMSGRSYRRVSAYVLLRLRVQNRRIKWNFPLNFRTVAYPGLLLKGPSFRATE